MSDPAKPVWKKHDRAILMLIAASCLVLNIFAVSYQVRNAKSIKEKERAITQVKDMVRILGTRLDELEDSRGD